MLTILARIIFILAAGLGLRALGGRTSRRPAARRRDGSRREASAASRSENRGAAASLPRAGVSTPATFASFGGSAVTASVAGRTGVDGGVGGHRAETRGTQGTTVAAATTPALADPDPNGPTPGAEDRLGNEADALAQKHRSPAFAADFRSVDYGGKVKPAWPHRDADAPDDGWTVPDPAIDHRIAVPSESPAAFKGSGGAAPLRGAPEDDAAARDQDAAEVGGTAETASSANLPVAGVEPSVPTGDAAVSGNRAAPAPTRLDAPRDGVPDDLTRIAGIGPSIERLLFESGIFHFHQIACWTPADVRWADRLTGFDGRAAREKWVEQAQLLGAASAK